MKLEKIVCFYHYGNIMKILSKHKMNNHNNIWLYKS